MKSLRRLVQRFWPSTLRLRLMLVLLPVVGLPIVATGYVLERRGHQALIEEKQVHLQGVNTLLLRHLEGLGGYRGLLGDYRGPAEDRAAQVRHLNERLRDFTDDVAAAFPDVGVGFFHRQLGAILTYGPSAQYDRTVGMTIPPEHPGWKVMGSGQPMTVSGDQVRGNIMNAMLPIEEDGSVVGYIWANEFVEAIDQQSGAMRGAVQTMTLLGVVLSLGVVGFVISQLTRSMEKIKQGLLRMRSDLGEPIPPIKGEIGEIVEAINDMARDLLETRSMHHNILDGLADAVITVDAGSRVSYLNPAACELFRCAAADVVGQPYTTLFRADANFSSLVLDTLESGREHRGVELDYPLPYGTPRVLASTGRFFDGRGHPLGVVAVIRDVSERYSLQEQVARADRLAAIGEVAAGIAHELRTPLTSIRGFVQYLQGSTDPREWQEYGDVIKREVDGLNRIVSELLDLVRPRPLRPESAQLERLVEETLVLARESSGESRIRFVLDFAADLPPVEIDRGQIKQVLLNVIINAIQAISGAGEIRIVAARHGAEAVAVRVSDTGCGIAPADRERIFDPFFSTKPSGTGLGMAIARRIIEDHRGQIEVDSVEGEGSTITLILPVRPEKD